LPSALVRLLLFLVISALILMIALTVTLAWLLSSLAVAVWIALTALLLVCHLDFLPRLPKNEQS
jgi:hypothetical protein